MTRLSHIQRTFLCASFGPRILDLLSQDESCARVFPQTIAKAITEKDTTRLPEILPAFLQQISGMTTQPHPDIARWLCTQYLSHRHNGLPIMAEDFYKIGEDLSYFNSIKSLPAFKSAGGKSNILDYATMAAWQSSLEPSRQRQKDKATQKRFRLKDADAVAQLMQETTILYNGPEGRIVIPHTIEASRYWGNNTKWCIAGKEERYFHYYNYRSPVMILLPQNDMRNKIALIHGDIWDAADTRMENVPVPHLKLLRSAFQGMTTDMRESFIKHLPYNDKESIAGPRPDHRVKSAYPTEWDNAFFSLMLGLGNSVATELYRNEEFVLAALDAHHEDVLAHIDPKRLLDRDFAMAAVSRDSKALKYLKAFQADEDIVGIAVAKDGCALKYADKELSGNKNIVTIAALNDGSAMNYASEDLKADAAFALPIVTANGNAYAYIDYDLKRDRRFALAAVTSEAHMIDNLPRHFHADRDIMLSAIKRYSLAYRLADDSLTGDMAFNVDAVQANFPVMEYVDDAFKADKAFITSCLAVSDDLPFYIRASKDMWQPDDAAVQKAQRDALNRLETANPAGFRERCRHFKEYWGNSAAILGVKTAVSKKISCPSRAQG